MPKNSLRTILTRSALIALVLSLVIEFARDLALQSYTEMTPPIMQGELEQLTYVEAKSMMESRSTQISGLQYFRRHAGSASYWEMKIANQFSYLFFAIFSGCLCFGFWPWGSRDNKRLEQTGNSAVDSHSL